MLAIQLKVAFSTMVKRLYVCTIAGVFHHTYRHKRTLQFIRIYFKQYKHTHTHPQPQTKYNIGFDVTSDRILVV